MESFLKNPFQNPFGGAMNPSGGSGGGVLEQIQEQVNTNGETLQSLQGGIGGLPSGNLPPGGIGGGTVNRSDGPGGDIKPPTLGGFVPEPPPMMTGTPPIMTEPQDPMPDFRSMITDRYKREGVDDGFFDSEFYLNTFDGGGMSGIFGGPEGQVAAMSKYFGSGGSNSGSRDKAYENYLRATGQEDKIKTGHDYNDIGGNIFNLNDITQPIPGSSNFTPTPRPPHLESGMLNSQNMFDRQTGQTGALGQMGGMDQLFGRAFAGKPI
jgi:hypothetical protein